jgi:chromosome segregation ATPase
VKLPALIAGCPNFEGPLPWKVHSPVSVDAIQIFVGTLEGAPPVITTENVNYLFLLCKEFGFASLLSEVTDFISAHSVVEEEARNVVSDIAEDNFQIKEALCPLQEALSGLGTSNLHLVRATESLQQSLSLLQNEVADLCREISRQAEENSVLHERQVNEGEALKQEIAELKETQKREIAALRSQFTEQDSALREEFAESSWGQQRENAARTEEIIEHRKQQEKFLQELTNHAQEQEALKREIAALGRRLYEKSRPVERRRME